MKMKLTAVAVAAALGVPVAASAAEHDVQVYGKAHVSVDFYSKAEVNDQGRDSDADDSGIGVSSNSSRIGFKGTHKLNESSNAVIWQYESQVDIDRTEGTALSTRNTFVGLKGGWGKAILGHHDTPLKRALTKWDPFNETVGEGRTVFGQGEGGAGQSGDYNERADNAIMYWTPKFGGFQASAIWSAQQSSGDDSTGDDNEEGLWGASLEYAGDMFDGWLAYENQMNRDQDDDTGMRASGIFKFGGLGLGLLWESLDDSGAGKRDGYGVWASFKLGKWVPKIGYYAVGEWKDQPATGADQTDSDAAVTSIALDYRWDKQTKVYFQYSALAQGDAADFRLGRRGHGDKYRGVSDSGTGAPYTDPSAFSVGMIYKF